MKRYLLDTHLVYWWMKADARIGKETQRTIIWSEIVVSTLSLWEMALKNASGKLPLPDIPIAASLEAEGFLLLSVLPRHIDAARNLKIRHTDPFDRLLIAQATDERLTLLTRDSSILSLGLECVLEAP